MLRKRASDPLLRALLGRWYSAAILEWQTMIFPRAIVHSLYNGVFCLLQDVCTMRNPNCILIGALYPYLGVSQTYVVHRSWGKILCSRLPKEVRRLMPLLPPSLPPSLSLCLPLPLSLCKVLGWEDCSLSLLGFRIGGLPCSTSWLLRYLPPPVPDLLGFEFCLFLHPLASGKCCFWQ